MEANNQRRKAMQTELEKILESVQGMKNATESEIKGIKESISDFASKATGQEAQMAELMEAVADLEQKSGLTVYADQEAKQKEVKAAQRKAMSELIRTGRKSNGFELTSNENILAEVKADGGMTIEAGSAGEGIEEEISRSILTAMREQYRILSLVNSYTVQSVDHWRMVQETFSTAEWDGENTGNSAPSLTGAPTLTKIQAYFGKLRSNVFVTNEALKDPIFDVESFLVNDVITEMSRKVADTIINGTTPSGSFDVPKGILQYFDLTDGNSTKPDFTPDGTGQRPRNCYEEIQWEILDDQAGWTIPPDTPSEDIINVFRDLVLSLTSGYLPNSGWLMNRDTYDMISRLQDAEKRYYLQPDLSGATAGSFLGYPIWIEDHMPSAGSSDGSIANSNIFVLFGDFKKAFNMIDYVGLSMLRNPYIVPGNVNFHFEQRVGSMMGDNCALKGLRAVDVP